MAVRVCSCCESLMQEGYVIDTGELEYYCSNTCLHENFTEEEYKELHESDLDSAYFTDWIGCEMDSEDYYILMYRLLEKPSASEIANVLDVLNREQPANYAPHNAIHYFINYLNEHAMNE